MISILKNEEKRTLLFMIISGIFLVPGFFDVGTLHVGIHLFGIEELSLNLSWVAILLCGIPILQGAIVGLVTEFDIKADVLVSLALIGSVIIGETFAAGEVAFIMTIGAYLEERTVRRARAGIEELVHLTPQTARVVRAGSESVIPAEQVEKGDILRVFAGETIAVDGIITKGQTSVDMSVMTGESMPVDKSAGDEVKSGTVNQFGTFDMVAEKVGEDSSLQRMIRLVESADAGKAKIVGKADRWATWIVVIALTAAVITWAVTGEAIRAVTILVVFCPCALVLATPTAIMAGIGNASKYGILVSQGDALERLAGVRRIAFDKTGTLTYGKPAVVMKKSSCADLSDSRLLELTASAEMRSSHPLGRAIVADYKQNYDRNPDQPEAFEMLPGRGVYALTGGIRIYAGNEALMQDHDISLPEAVASEVAAYKADGCTIIYITDGEQFLGYVALADTIRPDAAETITAIREAGAEVVLLTGDTPEAAGHIAGMAGISEVRSGCLPEDKLRIIKEFQQSGENVCMVGDGINDAPALKAAQAGIAMGVTGSDIAIGAADTVLTRDDIREIPHLLALSKKVMRTININLTASMALNFAAIILAIAGVLGPVVGALVHNVGSVVVIINSSLLLTWRKHVK